MHSNGCSRVSRWPNSKPNSLARATRPRPSVAATLQTCPSWRIWLTHAIIGSPAIHSVPESGGIWCFRGAVREIQTSLLPESLPSSILERACFWACPQASAFTRVSVSTFSATSIVTSKPLSRNRSATIRNKSGVREWSIGSPATAAQTLTETTIGQGWAGNRQKAAGTILCDSTPATREFITRVV